MATKQEIKSGLAATDAGKIFRYEPETGRVFWLVDRYAGEPGRKIISAGDEAGSLSGSGYRVIRVNYCLIYAHRLAWLLTHGEWPQEKLDHINCNRSDNRIANLRPATDIQNRSNTRCRAKIGFKGVYKPKHANTYCARISVNGATKYLGCFPTPQEAHGAYVAAAEAHFGEFARAE